VCLFCRSGQDLKISSDLPVAGQRRRLDGAEHLSILLVERRIDATKSGRYLSQSLVNDNKSFADSCLSPQLQFLVAMLEEK